jgi:glycine oxidase
VADRSENHSEVLIVGAGVIGLSCAWRLAQRGFDVRVLERAEPGAGATGVAAGMLAPVGEATWGEEAQLELALASHALWPAFAQELGTAGRDPGYARLGSLHVALDRDEAAELERRYELMRERGLEAEWLAPGTARRREPALATAAGAAISAPHEAAVDPARLIASLRAAATEAGVRLDVGVEAREALHEGNRIEGVRDAAGEEHRAEVVVLAAGCWSAAEWLPERARPPVRPVKGQVLTLGRAGTQAPIGGIVATERIYAVPRSDGRLVIGATVEEMGFDTTVTAGAVHELLREAYRAIPDVAEMELEGVRAGLRPGTPDNAPIIGFGPVEGLLFATGHFRNGILLAPLTADAVAAIATGEAPPASLAAADPGRFRAPAEVLSR